MNKARPVVKLFDKEAYVGAAHSYHDKHKGITPHGDVIF